MSKEKNKKIKKPSCLVLRVPNTQHNPFTICGVRYDNQSVTWALLWFSFTDKGLEHKHPEPHYKGFLATEVIDED